MLLSLTETQTSTPSVLPSDLSSSPVSTSLPHTGFPGTRDLGNSRGQGLGSHKSLLLQPAPNYHGSPVMIMYVNHQGGPGLEQRRNRQRGGTTKNDSSGSRSAHPCPAQALLSMALD